MSWAFAMTLTWCLIWSNSLCRADNSLSIAENMLPMVTNWMRIWMWKVLEGILALPFLTIKWLAKTCLLTCIYWSLPSELCILLIQSIIYHSFYQYLLMCHYHTHELRFNIHTHTYPTNWLLTLPWKLSPCQPPGACWGELRMPPAITGIIESKTRPSSTILS